MNKVANATGNCHRRDSVVKACRGIILPVAGLAFCFGNSAFAGCPCAGAAKAAASSPRPKTGSKGPAAGSLFLYPERIQIGRGRFVDAERGMMYVPLKRSDPKSAVIGIEVYRFKAEGNVARQTPPIFQLHGGPGFAGLAASLARPGYYEKQIRRFTKISELVVVGQRGIGSSKPTTACKNIQPLPLDRAVTDQQEVAAIRAACARCKGYWLSRGFDLSGLNVIEAAADVNDVRHALGYDKIVLWGVSFGSHWSMAVMRFHPQIVRRAVLSGMEGPNHTYDVPSYVLNSLKRIARAAEKSPQLREFIPKDGLLGAFKGVIASVEKKPVIVTVKHPETRRPQKVLLDARTIRRLALGYTARVTTRRGARSWPADVLALHSGDFSKAAEAVIRGRIGPNHTASFYMLDCGSGVSRQRAEKINADPAIKVVGRLNWLYHAACPVWEGDLGQQFRANFDTTIPTVIVQGNWDVSTPFENALELAPHFKKGHLVVVQGGTHAGIREALQASPAFRDAIAKFIQTGDMSELPKEVKLPPLNWVVPRLRKVSE